MPILEVKNIKKGFGDTDVLKGVSFSMERGQVLASAPREAEKPRCCGA